MLTPPTPDPIVGTWVARDVDGSAVTLTLAQRPGGDFDLTLHDPYGSGCESLGAEVTVYEGVGTAVREGNGIHVTWSTEHCGDFRLNSPPFQMTYVPRRDQIEGMNVTWDRSHPTGPTQVPQ